MIIYKYNGQEYFSPYALKKALPNVIFNNELDYETLKLLNIEAIEVEDPNPEGFINPLQHAKNTRNTKIQNLIVQYNNDLYDANEESINRMLFTLNAIEDNETIDWVLNNGTLKTLTKSQLNDVYKMAVKEFNKLWVEPYNTKES